MKKNSCIFWTLTIGMILISHSVMVFLHEWTHSFIAWLFEYKNNPFAIEYPSNWVTFWGISEKVPYHQILAEGKRGAVAMIAIAPIVDGILFFFIGLNFLSKKAIQKNWLVFSFFYWWTLMEISEIYSYIPIRTFFSEGDIFNFLSTVKISPWVILIPGTVFVGWGLDKMIRIKELQACDFLGIETKLGRFTFLFITLLIVFLYFGGAVFAFVYPKIKVNILSWISLGFIPLYLFFLRKRYS